MTALHEKLSKYPILDTLHVPENILSSWQKLLNLISEIFEVPAALIMRVHAYEIEVFLASQTEINPYNSGSKEHLDSGLYCETVMDTKKMLHIANALKSADWAIIPISNST